MVYLIRDHPKSAGVSTRQNLGEIKMDFTTLATSLGSGVTTAITAAIPVIVIVLGARIGYRVFKSFVKG
jgi:uncharacterized membrane-anchored protein